MAMITGWFKVIQNGMLIGVATNQEFARYSEDSDNVHICDAMNGEYILVYDRYYHDDWMLPVNPKSYLEYEDATVLSVSKDEYDILFDRGEDNVVQFTLSAPKDIPEKVLKEEEEVTIDFVRERKIAELSESCKESIENGFSLTLSDGAEHHFSMSNEDQLNMLDLQMALAQHDELVYHADGELMQYYSEPDAQDILTGARKWRNYNLTLFNSLKNWIHHLQDIATINAITYDAEIPDEYVTSVLETLTENF